MNDLIIRKALYDKIAGLEEQAKNSVIRTPRDSQEFLMYCTMMNERTALKHEIAVAPDAEVSHWIPCSERLPEEEGWYLESVVCGSVERTGLGLFKKGIFEHFDDEIKTVAWMPLPEPYKGGIDNV